MGTEIGETSPTWIGETSPTCILARGSLLEAKILQSSAYEYGSTEVACFWGPSHTNRFYFGLKIWIQVLVYVAQLATQLKFYLFKRKYATISKSSIFLTAKNISWGFLRRTWFQIIPRRNYINFVNSSLPLNRLYSRLVPSHRVTGTNEHKQTACDDVFVWISFNHPSSMLDGRSTEWEWIGFMDGLTLKAKYDPSSVYWQRRRLWLSWRV